MNNLKGILGVALIVMALFLNTNSTNSSNGDLDLASLVSINTANAEEECRTGVRWTIVWDNSLGHNVCYMSGAACCI